MLFVSGLPFEWASAMQVSCLRRRVGESAYSFFSIVKLDQNPGEASFFLNVFLGATTLDQAGCCDAYVRVVVLTGEQKARARETEEDEGGAKKGSRCQRFKGSGATVGLMLERFDVGTCNVEKEIHVPLRGGNTKKKKKKGASGRPSNARLLIRPPPCAVWIFHLKYGVAWCGDDE